MHGVALRNDVARAPFTLAALRGYAQLELDLFKAHACACVAGDVAVRDAVANTDNHDAGRVGWQLTMPEYKCECLAFTKPLLDSGNSPRAKVFS